MIKKTSLSLLAGAVFFLGGTTIAVAGPNGADLAADKCEHCHGKTGNATDENEPNIAGFSTVYFVDPMKAYKTGDRPSEKFTAEGHDETDMKAVTEALSDAELAALADYFAAQEFEARQQDFNRKLAKKGKKVYKRRCKKCHTNYGAEPDDDAGILAGQATGYLKNQLGYFKEGVREQPKKMKKQFKKLKKGDIEKLLNFFASQ